MDADHGLEYAAEASVRVNQANWISLSKSAQIAEPGRSYGGIRGGFAMLKLTVLLGAGTVIRDDTTIQFRSNQTDRVVSGFREFFQALRWTPGMEGCRQDRNIDPRLLVAPSWRATLPY